MIVALYFTKNDKLKCNNMKSRVLFEAQECNKYEISKWDNIKRGKFLWVPHASFHEFLMQVSTSSLKKKKKKPTHTMILKDQESNIVKRFLRGISFARAVLWVFPPYQEEHGECFLQKKGFKRTNGDVSLAVRETEWLVESFLEIIKDQRIWCFQTVALKKTLECPLNSKEIKSVSPKGNQPS